MDLQLTDKVAVVAGASKGIGLAVTRELVADSLLARRLDVCPGRPSPTRTRDGVP